jgi:deoxyadenosine/deoxycytidine kinase
MLDPATVVQDRTIYEDAEIFERNLHAQGYISDRDHRMYRDLYETLCAALQPPDVMIFLNCPVKTLKKRIAGRGREMEKDIPTEYLTRLHKLYARWRENYDTSPVIDLDTSKLDYLTDLVHRLDVFKQIEKYL